MSPPDTQSVQLHIWPYVKGQMASGPRIPNRTSGDIIPDTLFHGWNHKILAIQPEAQGC